MSRSERVETRVDGRQLSLSHLDKVMFPATGFTKGQLIDYYAHIAPVMLPHVIDRPVTFRRYPDGVESKSFSREACAVPHARVGADRRGPIDVQPGRRVRCRACVDKRSSHPGVGGQIGCHRISRTTLACRSAAQTPRPS